MDELGRWKIIWALVDDKPERILDILHAKTVTNTGYILWATNDCPTYHLCIYTDMCKSTCICLLITLFADEIGALTS